MFTFKAALYRSLSACRNSRFTTTSRAKAAAGVNLYYTEKNYPPYFSILPLKKYWKKNAYQPECGRTGISYVSDTPNYDQSENKTQFVIITNHVLDNGVFRILGHFDSRSLTLDADDR